MDNLVGHKNPARLLWCLSHGILPLYTPLDGSWLNMAESIQRLLKRRALTGQYRPNGLFKLWSRWPTTGILSLRLLFGQVNVRPNVTVLSSNAIALALLGRRSFALLDIAFYPAPPGNRPTSYPELFFPAQGTTP
jgi:hypothetical protein